MASKSKSKSKSKRKSARKSAAKSRPAASACCPVIYVSCKGAKPAKGEQDKRVCVVREGARERKGSPSEAGQIVGKWAALQKKRRCIPLVKTHQAGKAKAAAQAKGAKVEAGPAIAVPNEHTHPFEGYRRRRSRR